MKSETCLTDNVYYDKLYVVVDISKYRVSENLYQRIAIIVTAIGKVTTCVPGESSVLQWPTLTVTTVQC